MLPPEPVEAFPDELVWHMKTHKKIIRRFKPFAEFQKFLVAETTSGNISRQEVVSMIPPHFLDVKPGMVVLDMCAAPGSKSAQLAEMIHGDEEERVRKAVSSESHGSSDAEGDYSDDGRSTGLLIANDTDYKRAGMLVHQVKRLNFPNLIVTQHDASIFPSIEFPSNAGEKRQYLKFDRVLCDVPCSGDGTARKNPNVWQKWTPRDGLGLYNLQLRILFRGLQLLKKGGRLVYSTCSMNPVENEAVVASAIEACGGISKVQLVDSSDHLPNLIRRPGLNKWKVLDTSSIEGTSKSNHMFTSWDAFQKTKEKYEVEEPGRQFSPKIAPGVFPPIASSEEQRIPLERCMRVYPHLQDTGGFFIAVLEKLDDIKVTQVQNPSQKESSKVKNDSESAVPTPVKLDDAPEVNLEPAGQQNGEMAEPTSPKRKLTEVEEGTQSSKRAKTDIDGEDTKPATDDVVKQEVRNREVPKLKPEDQSQKEYFEYVPADDPTLQEILDFFGISPRFPRDRFMVKNKEALLLNKIYYTSELAKTIISQNKNRGMKFIHCGVVMFVSHRIKDVLKAPWRLQNEGIQILEPWASKRIVTCKSRDTLYKMLIEMFPKLPKDGSHGLDDVGDQLTALDVGCAFIKIDKSDGEDGFPFPMVLPVWRHPGSVNLMVDKDTRTAMLLRLFNEQNPQIFNHVVEKAKADAKAAEDLINEEEAEAEEDKEVEKEVEEEEIGEANVDEVMQEA